MPSLRDVSQSDPSATPGPSSSDSSTTPGPSTSCTPAISGESVSLLPATPEASEAANVPIYDGVRYVWVHVPMDKVGTLLPAGATKINPYYKASPPDLPWPTKPFPRNGTLHNIATYGLVFLTMVIGFPIIKLLQCMYSDEYYEWTSFRLTIWMVSFWPPALAVIVSTIALVKRKAWD